MSTTVRSGVTILRGTQDAGSWWPENPFDTWEFQVDTLTQPLYDLGAQVKGGVVFLVGGNIQTTNIKPDAPLPVTRYHREGPIGGVGGVARGVPYSISLRHIDIGESNPGPTSLAGFSLSADITPFFGDFNRLVYGTDPQGNRISRLEAAAFLALDITMLGELGAAARVSDAAATGRTLRPMAISVRSGAGGTWGGFAPTKRAEELARLLPRSGSMTAVERGTTTLEDIATLASSQGAEFAVVRIGDTRYLVRGSATSTVIPEEATLVLHVHPGAGVFGLRPSTEDMEALIILGQDRSALLNEGAVWRTFGPEGPSPYIHNYRPPPPLD